MAKKKYSDKYISRRRILWVYSTIVLLLVVLTGFLFRIMVLDPGKLKDKAMRQWTSKVQIAPKRGRIMDRRGNELAISGNLFRIDLDLNTLRKGVSDKKFTMEELAENMGKILEMNKEEVYKKLTIKGPKGEEQGYAILKRRVEDDKATAIKKMAADMDAYGIIISPDTKRYYPNGNFASQVIGHTNSDGKGLTGLELMYDKELAGIPGEILNERDVYQQDLPYGINQYYPPVEGKDVYTTIDEQIQHFAEKHASELQKNTEAEAVSILVMDPNNGEILAMATTPGYDLNSPWGDGSASSDELQKLWRNRAVSDAMEPGSIYKVITAYAALKEGFVTDTEAIIVNCTGSFTVGKTTMRCWKTSGHGPLSFAGILQNSCNPGFGLLGEKLGMKKVEEYARLFGFGKKTGIDLSGESSGIVKKAENMYPVDVATISFGQANTASMIQYLTAFNTVANGGTRYTPHLMKEIRGKDYKGNVFVDKEYQDPSKQEAVIDSALAKQLRDLLERVIAEGGGKKAYVDGFEIAGKTGTAQIPNPNGGGYQDGNYLSSFVGMAPANNPQVTVMVQILRPNPSNYYAGQIAAPVGKAMFLDIFNYLALGPTSYDFKSDVVKNVMVPEIRGKSKDEIAGIMKDSGLKYEIQGEGNVIIDLLPKPGFQVGEGTKVIVVTGDAGQSTDMVAIPYLHGLTRAEATELLNTLGLKANFVGNEDIVSSQSISKNTEVKVGTTIDLHLERLGD